MATLGVDDHRRAIVQLWDVATRRRVGPPITGPDWQGWDDQTYFTFHRLAFSPDGKFLATHDYESVRLWDVATRRQAGSPIIGDFHFLAIAFSSDGKLLATCTADDGHGAVRLWDIATRQPIGKPLTGLTQFIYRVAFHPNSKLLVVSDSNKIRLWIIPGQ
jgi:WD40 repeat protein